MKPVFQRAKVNFKNIGQFTKYLLYYIKELKTSSNYDNNPEHFKI